jgi:outer membrane protein TolC
VTEKAVAAAEEALRLVREQYQAGTATVTRYLEAEAALADARSRAISSRTDVRRSGAELRKAIGGWK